MRHIAWICLTAVIAASSARAQPAAAHASCVLVATGQAAAEAQGVTLELPTRLADCNTVKVISGEITACYVDVTEQRQCVLVPPGHTFAETARGAPSTSTRSVWFSIASLLRGDASTRPAVSRGQPREGRLPFGIVLLPGPDLHAQLASAGVGHAKEFSIRSDDPMARVVYSVIDPGIDLGIPATTLARGHSYKWTLRGDSSSVSGTFTIADESRAKDLQDARDLLQDASLTPVATDVLLVELFNERGYFFERDMALQNLKFLTKPAKR